jgi:hypothetical protein
VRFSGSWKRGAVYRPCILHDAVSECWDKKCRLWPLRTVKGAPRKTRRSGHSSIHPSAPNWRGLCGPTWGARAPLTQKASSTSSYSLPHFKSLKIVTESQKATSFLFGKKSKMLRLFSGCHCPVMSTPLALDAYSAVYNWERVWLVRPAALPWPSDCVVLTSVQGNALMRSFPNQISRPTLSRGIDGLWRWLHVLPHLQFSNRQTWVRIGHRCFWRPWMSLAHRSMTRPRPNGFDSIKTQPVNWKVITSLFHFLYPIPSVYHSAGSALFGQPLSDIHTMASLFRFTLCPLRVSR